MYETNSVGFIQKYLYLAIGHQVVAKLCGDYSAIFGPTGLKHFI